MLIFIHVPKTGGSSIRNHVKIENPEALGNRAHPSARDWRDAIGQEAYDAATKFAVVRDPIVRYNSACAQAGLAPDLPTTWDFVRQFDGRWQAGGISAILMQRQVDMLTIDGKLAVDKVFRFEEDLSGGVCQWLKAQGVEGDQLPHSNVNPAGSHPLPTGQTLEFIKDFYADDFSLFGYSMEP